MQLFYTVTYLYKHECLTRLKQMLLHRSGYIYRRCKELTHLLKRRQSLEEKMPLIPLYTITVFSSSKAQTFSVHSGSA